jgi:hypothetical protein
MKSWESDASGKGEFANFACLILIIYTIFGTSTKIDGTWILLFTEFFLPESPMPFAVCRFWQYFLRFKSQWSMK